MSVQLSTWWLYCLTFSCIQQNSNRKLWKHVPKNMENLYKYIKFVTTWKTMYRKKNIPSFTILWSQIPSTAFSSQIKWSGFKKHNPHVNFISANIMCPNYSHCNIIIHICTFHWICKESKKHLGSLSSLGIGGFVKEITDDTDHFSDSAADNVTGNIPYPFPTYNTSTAEDFWKT